MGEITIFIFYFESLFSMIFIFITESTPFSIKKYRKHNNICNKIRIRKIRNGKPEFEKSYFEREYSYHNKKNSKYKRIKYYNMNYLIQKKRKNEFPKY